MDWKGGGTFFQEFLFIIFFIKGKYSEKGIILYRREFY
jgi:hypothetical protein